MILPADIDAELGAVGAVIERQGQGLDELLKPGILTNDNAIRLRNVVRALVSEGQAIDSVTVGMRFDDDQLLSNAIDLGTPGLNYLLPILRQKAALRSIRTNAEKDLALVARLDHERRDIAAPLTEAVLRSDAERRETLDRITGATLAEQSIFFSGASRSWWVRTTAGSFVEMDKTMIVKELIRLGLSPKVKDDGLSEIDEFLLRANKEPVCYSGPLAGHKAGPIDHPNGRILVTQPCKPLLGVDEPCPTIMEWLNQLCGNDQQQYFTLLIWMHFRRRALLTNTWRPGQLLVLAGPRGCGKSFLQSKIITPLLGGRIARPYRYMHGGTEFNAELFAAEHLCIEDESPARDLHSRRTLGNHVKSMLFAAVQSCHPKGRTPINITPIWAMSLSVNEEPENLMVLPPIDDALTDKLIILKCRKPEPPPGHPEEMQALLMMAKRELPAFANYLDTLPIPHDYTEPRTGLIHYHNPEILEVLQGLSPEAKLDQLVTAAFFQDSTEWEGKALELETALTRRDSPWQHEAQRLFTFNTACGVYLARLAAAMPDRYRKRTIHGEHRWRIRAPKCLPDTTETE
jgi:hypothetical protein